MDGVDASNLKTNEDGGVQQQSASASPTQIASGASETGMCVVAATLDPQMSGGESSGLGDGGIGEVGLVEEKRSGRRGEREEEIVAGPLQLKHLPLP